MYSFNQMMYSVKMFSAISITVLLITNIFCNKIKKDREDEKTKELLTLLELLKTNNFLNK